MTQSRVVPRLAFGGLSTGNTHRMDIRIALAAALG